MEKTVERCDLSIVEGVPDEDNVNEDHDSLESKLIIRLHCKHGMHSYPFPRIISLKNDRCREDTSPPSPRPDAPHAGQPRVTHQIEAHDRLARRQGHHRTVSYHQDGRKGRL